MSRVIGRLDRYIIAAIFGLSAVVGLGLVTLYSFISFITEIDQGSKSLGVAQIFWITVLMMPSGLHLLMPLVAMLGTLLGVGQLASQSELTAMRAAGYSNLRIGRSALIAGLLLGLLAVLLGESLAPAGLQAAERMKSASRSAASSSEVGAGPIWLRSDGNIFFIRRLLSEHQFADAEIYRFDDALVLQSILSVEQARYVKGIWQFSEVTETRFLSGRVEVERVATREWTRKLEPELLQLYVLQADTVSALGLLRLVRYLDANGLDASEQRLELWRKLIAPLTVMAMVLFAVPFVFGPTRGGGAGQRLLIGVLVGVSFHLINEVSANLGALYGWSAPMSAGLPTALLMLAAVLRLGTSR